MLAVFNCLVYELLLRNQAFSLLFPWPFEEEQGPHKVINTFNLLVSLYLHSLKNVYYHMMCLGVIKRHVSIQI